MKNFIVILLMIVGLNQSAFAQEVRYKVKKDNPNDIKNFVIHIDPWFADVYFSDLAMGVAVRADWLMNKVLDASFEYRVPYFDMNYMEAQDFSVGELVSNQDYIAKNGFSRYTYMEPIIRLHFSDKIKTKTHRLILAQSSYTSGNYKYTNTKYIDVPGKARSIAALEGGACWMDFPILFDGLMNDASGFTFKPKTGGAEVAGSESTDGGTMMRTMSFIGGLSFQRVNNLKALTDNYGVKYSTMWTNFYLDAMFAPVLNFADVVDKDGTVWDVKHNDINRLGFRLGYAIKNTKGTTWSMKFNMGSRPGIKGASSFFMDFNFGIAIANRIKLLPSKKA